MRLIDALELKRSISASALCDDGKHIFDIIDEQPTIEPKKQKIAYLVNPNPYGECSECGQLIDSRDGFNFCPNCGSYLLREGESDG